MQFKPVPQPPAELALLESVRRALPETAGDIDDCCRHLVDETPLADRDEAATWLTFLRALELATEEQAGFRRCDGASGGTADDPSTPDRDRLRRSFRERVYGADAALAALERADDPLTADAVAEATRPDRQQSGGRTRGPNRPAETRRKRVERLLEWAVLLELAARDGDGYRAARERG